MDERDFNLPDYVQMIDEVKQELEQEREKIEEKTKLVDWAKQYLKGAQQELYNLHLDMKKLQEELSKQQKENESLKQQLIEERERRAMREMELAEMSKLSAGMAKKSSEEALLKALSAYVNRSKRKTAGKNGCIGNRQCQRACAANGFVDSHRQFRRRADGAQECDSKREL